LIAYFDARDRHHDWSREVFGLLTPPLYTCDAVIAETAHLLRDLTRARDSLLEMIERQDLLVEPVFPSEAASIRRLLAKYEPRIDLADACLVRLSELHRDCRVITLDSDFTIYRRHGRERIPLLAPFAG
jgi:predicted nucleic acid-binding protein